MADELEKAEQLEIDNRRQNYQTQKADILSKLGGSLAATLRAAN